MSIILLGLFGFLLFFCNIFFVELYDFGVNIDMILLSLLRSGCLLSLLIDL